MGHTWMRLQDDESEILEKCRRNPRDDPDSPDGLIVRAQEL